MNKEPRYTPPSVFLESAASTQVEALGKPTINYDPETSSPLDGNRYSYFVEEDRIVTFMQEDNINSVVALMLHFLRQSNYEYLIQHAEKLPNLKALGLVYGEDYDLCLALAAFPDLEYLYVAYSKSVEFSLVRHANLREITVFGNTPLLMTSCSFPNLEYLELGCWDIDEQIKQFANAGFTKLQHIGFYDDEGEGDNILYFLEHAALPVSLKSASFHPDTQSKHVEQLAKLPIAKQLTHLSFYENNIRYGKVFNQADFPALRYLCLRGYKFHLPNLQGMDLPELATLDFRSTGLCNTDVEGLIAFIQHFPKLQNLLLNYSDINDEKLLAQLHDLPVKVSL